MTQSNDQGLIDGLIIINIEFDNDAFQIKKVATPKLKRVTTLQNEKLTISLCYMELSPATTNPFFFFLIQDKPPSQLF